MEIDRIDSAINAMQNVKKRFFALRNGVVADMLRRAGSPYRIIFGLNLPQLQEIASVMGKDAELAAQLWANSTTRESRLLAPMLVKPEMFKIDEALQWLADVRGTEEIDIFCHTLLRKTDFVEDLFNRLVDIEQPLMRYVACRLGFTLLASKPTEVKSMALKEIERNDSLTQRIANQLLDEANFFLER